MTNGRPIYSVVRLRNGVKDYLMKMKVKRMLARKGKTMGWLAEQMGISPTRIGQILKQDDLMLSTLKRLAHNLDCKVGDLVDE